MPIPNNDVSSSKDVFFTERFKVLIRSEKELLIRQASSTAILETNQVQAYRNDFYRLMRAHNIEPHLWWATAYINGIENPSQDISGMVSFLTLNESTIASAIARSNTVRG